MGEVIKRTFDFILAFFGLIVASPFMLLVAIVIKLDSPGPAIFRQERIGRRGKPFTLYKFRSMYIDAEKDGAALFHEGDNRVTKVGKFIRDFHLDELPNLWNVLEGDMSFVGYRPERQVFIDEIMKHDSRYVELYAMRPGIFSEATLYNGYTDTMEKMVKRLEMDLEYMRKHTIWLDIKIIFLTVFSILSGKKI